MKKLLKLWPLFFILTIWTVLFWPFFFKGLLPIPADIITGVYFPWLDYKWGFSVGVPVKNPLISDIPSILIPWRFMVIDELKQGRLPLWNPYYFTGMPLLANFQSAVFSYVNIFFLFLPKALAWSVGVMVSPILTLLAMYGFLRHKKLNQFSSLLGAVVFSLSGFEIAWLEYNVHGHTALFLPVLLLLIDLVFEGKKWPLFLIPFCIAFQIFSGYIPVVIYTYAVCLLYVLFFYFFPQVKTRFTQSNVIASPPKARRGNLGRNCFSLNPDRDRNDNWSNYIYLLFFWILGLGISAVQLLPGYELTSLSIRKTDPIVSASNASYLPIKNLVTAIAPDFFGNPATYNYFGTAFYDNFYFFAGTGTLLLGFFTIFFLKKNKNILFWWGMLVFSLILCFKNPLGLFWEKILFLSGGVASKALFITDFSLAILSAWGLNEFLKSNRKDKKKIIFPILFLAISSLFSILSAFRLEGNFQNTAIRNLIIPGVVLAFCSFVLLLMIKFSKTFILPLLLILLISAQLLYSARKYLPFSKQELLFPNTPVIDFLKQKQAESKEPFRVELGEVIPQNFLMPYGIETSSGYDALLPQKTGELLSEIENGKKEEQISRVRLIRNFESPSFPLLNTKYILAKKMDKNGIYSPEGNTPDIFKKERFNMVFEDKTVVVYEDLWYLPRANFYESGEKISDLNKLVKEFAGQKALSSNSKIEWKNYLPLEKSFTVNSPIGGYLVLLESGFTGWQAFVNGKEVAIEEPLQTIKIPTGENEVIFKYLPNSFIWGIRISIASLTGLLSVLIIESCYFVFKKRSHY